MCLNIKTVPPLLFLIIQTILPYISVSLIFFFQKFYSVNIMLDREFTLSWSYSSLNNTNLLKSLFKALFCTLFSLHPYNFCRTGDNIQPLYQSSEPLELSLNKRVIQVLMIVQLCTRQCKTEMQILYPFNLMFTGYDR